MLTPLLPNGLAGGQSQSLFFQGFMLTPAAFVKTLLKTSLNPFSFRASC